MMKDRKKWNEYLRDYRHKKLGRNPQGYNNISDPRSIVKNLGYDLKSYEDIHHIDGNRKNNNILNLLVLPSIFHRKNHKRIIHLESINRGLKIILNV